MRVNCHFPITLRIVGSPSDAQLAELGQGLARAVASRLAEADRVLADRLGCDTAGAVELAERYQPDRDTAGGYAVASYQGGGQPVAVPVRRSGRGWVVVRTVSFPTTVGDFLDVVEAQREDHTLPEKALYLDLSLQQRRVEVWLVRVLQDYPLADLSEELTQHAAELSHQRPDQTMATAVSPQDPLRSQLAELDPNGVLTPRIPSLSAHNAHRLEGVGSTATVRRGGWVLFAFMSLPTVELSQLAELGPAAQVQVPLRDVVGLVPAEEFERAYQLSWAEYAAEFGAESVPVWLQSLTVRRRARAAALDLLLERQLTPQLAAARGGRLGPQDVVSRRLMALTNTTVARLPGPARDAAVGWVDTGRTTQATGAEPAGQVAAGVRLLYAVTLLDVDAERLGIARYRPLARGAAAGLRRWLERDPDELRWRYDLDSYLREVYGEPPASRPPGGTLFEHVLAELGPSDLDRLFRMVEASGLFTLRHRLLLLCRATRWATDPRVVELGRALVLTVERNRHNRYWTAPAEVWLDREPGRTVRAGGVLGDLDPIYVASSERKQLRPTRADALRQALVVEREGLLDAILRGRDTTSYDQDSFARTVLARAVARIRLTDEDFQNVTVERSMRLRGVREQTVDALPKVQVEFEFVERIGRDPWTAVGDPVTESSDDFEARLVFWRLARAGQVYETAGLIISGIGLAAVAWEAGIVALLVELAGGGAMVGGSIAVSTVIYVLRVAFGDATLSARGFLEAALDGYLFALGFRTGTVLGSGIARLIGVDTLGRAVTGWIARRLVTGVVGGATSTALDMFAHDVLQVALDGGQWSGIDAYAARITAGAALGVVAEFALTPSLNAALGAGREVLGSATAVAARLRAAGWSASELVVVSTAALANLRAAIAQFAGEAAAGGFANAFARRVADIAVELGGRELAGHVLELSGARLTTAATAGLTRLLRALDAVAPQRAYQLTRVLAAKPAAAVGLLEAVAELDASATNRIVSGTFGSPGEQAAFLERLGRYSPDQQRAILDLLADLRATPSAPRVAASAGSRAFGFAVVDGAAGLRVGVRFTERAYAFNTPVDAEAVRRLLADIESRYPGSAVYVGSGGHGGEYGSFFATHPDLIESDFLIEDQESLAALEEIGVGRVLDLSEAGNLQLFRRAEAMARLPGQDHVFTIRAWCFSSRSRL